MKKIPVHNSILIFNTDEVTYAKLRFNFEEKDKKIFKNAGSRGDHSAMFADLKINPSEIEWIELDGKGIRDVLYDLDDESLLESIDGKIVEDWSLRLFKSENYKLKAIGELVIYYDYDGNIDEPENTTLVKADLFIKNEFFDIIKKGILSEGKEFIKKFGTIDLGFNVNKKGIQKMKEDAKKKLIHGLHITHYDMTFFAENNLWILHSLSVSRM